MGTQALPLAFNVLARTLREITEYLAHEVTHPSPEPPGWSEIEWRISMSVMALQGMAAPLARVRRWRGPEFWNRHVDKQLSHVELRAERVAQILERVDLAAQREGVALVALKGAALYRSQVYRCGERCLGDIDLLVEPADVAAATRAIVAVGYRQAFKMRRHTIFSPLGVPPTATFDEDIANPLKIELHTRIAEPLPFHEVEITDSIFPTERRPGINAYKSRMSLMRHLLLHAAGNIRARALRQVQLHDIALLARSMNADEWYALTESKEPRGVWWAFAPLQLAARYYAGCIPESAIIAARRSCPVWLQRVTARQELTDVSWSNLHISAFPGIEWSKSPLEALHFARGRIVPRRADLATLEYAVKVLPWAAQVPWYGQPHLKRIFRWVFARPPRAQTTYSVQAALSAE